MSGFVDMDTGVPTTFIDEIKDKIVHIEAETQFILPNTETTLQNLAVAEVVATTEPPKPNKQMKIVKFGDYTIYFDEDKHVYTVNGVIQGSVTKYISCFSPPFDEHLTACACAKSHNSKLEAGEKKISADHFKQLWKIDREYGSFLHSTLEMYAKYGIVDIEDPDFKDDNVYRILPEIAKLPDRIVRCQNDFAAVKAFLTEMDAKGWDIVGAEILCHDHELNLCGTPDIIWRSRTNPNLMKVGDYKTCKNLEICEKCYNAKCRKCKKGATARGANPHDFFCYSTYGKYCMQIAIYCKMLKYIYPNAVFEEGVIIHVRDGKVSLLPTYIPAGATYSPFVPLPENIVPAAEDEIDE